MWIWADPLQAGGSGVASTCAFDKSKIAVPYASFAYATPGCFDTCNAQNEDTLKDSLWKAGPVSICVQADQWLSYTGGILDGSATGCPHAYAQLNHCVQLVGFGNDGGTPFWTVRNSWGTQWGEQGFIRLRFGVNTCGMADEAIQVTS